MTKSREMIIKPFQYISALIAHTSLERLIDRAQQYAHIILDLEDSIMDLDCSETTRKLKQQARKNLMRLLNKGIKPPLGIRINSIDSKEFERDLKLLNALKQTHWDYIVLPKIESSNDLQSYQSLLKSVNFREIIICIESQKGAEQLENILKSKPSKLLSKVQFGHFDYFLSTDTFPIPDQNNALFWRTCESIIQICESNGYQYLHSPLCTLNSPDLMHQVIDKLKATCQYEFGMASISLNQSIYLSQYTHQTQRLPIELNEQESLDLPAIAQKTIDLFKQRKNLNFSFYHKDKMGQFIPPQAYLAALNFLAQHDN